MLLETVGLLRGGLFFLQQRRRRVGDGLGRVEQTAVRGLIAEVRAQRHVLQKIHPRQIQLQLGMLNFGRLEYRLDRQLSGLLRPRLIPKALGLVG